LQAEPQVAIVIAFIVWLFFIIIHLHSEMRRKKLREWDSTGLPLIFFALQLVGMLASIIYLSAIRLDMIWFFIVNLINFTLFLLVFVFSARNEVYALTVGSVLIHILTIYATASAYAIHF